MKTSTLIIGGLGLIGVLYLYRMTHPQTVVYGDEFGGAPPREDSYYFPRLGQEEPLAPFPQSMGIPFSPVGSIAAPQFESSPADYDVLPIQNLTPQTESNVNDKCTKVCDDCSQVVTGGPFQGGAFSNPIKRLRGWDPNAVQTTYGKA